MKLYKLFIAIIAFFQIFSCSCTEIKKRRQHAPRKKRFIKPEPLVFPTPIPAELQKYFIEPKIKMTFSEEIKTDIIKMCATNQKIKEYKKALILARKENDALREEGEKVRRKTADTLQQLTELRQKTQELPFFLSQK